MKIKELIPQPNDKVYFKLASFKIVPKQSGCYVLTTIDNEILYIGLSNNLFDRFQQHLGNPQKTNSTIKGKVVWFYYSIYDVTNLPKLERSWLNQYVAIHGERPLLNNLDSPVS